jgi:hypothetical protein
MEFVRTLHTGCKARRNRKQLFPPVHPVPITCQSNEDRRSVDESSTIPAVEQIISVKDVR